MEPNNIFLSYSWANKNTADDIDKNFQDIGIVLTRDIRDAPAYKPLTDFMKRIREGYAILLVSDAYLKSVNCLYEVIEFIQEKDFKSRMFPILLDDAKKIREISGQAEYVKFWDEKYKDCTCSLIGIDPGKVLELSNQLSKVKLINDRATEFINYISDILLPDLTELKETGYKPILDTIGISIPDTHVLMPAVHLPDSSVITEYDSKTLLSLLLAAVVGSWDEANENDKDVIGHLVGEDYKTWIQHIRNLRESGSDLVAYNLDIWTINNRISIFASQSSRLFGDHFNTIKDQMLRVFLTINPKYEEAKDEAVIELFSSKQPIYSSFLVKGLAESLAIMGNHPEYFSSYKQDKLLYMTAAIIKTIFGSDDWRVLASIQESFQFIAEANPAIFLRLLFDNIRKPESTIKEYVRKREEGIVPYQFGASLFQALVILACSADYFSNVCNALFSLSTDNEQAFTTLTGILLPWIPQTSATTAQRISIVKSLMSEDDELGWRLLVSLLPGKTTVGIPIERPMYLNYGEIPETYKTSEFWEVSTAYLETATKAAQANPQRVSSLIEFLDNIPREEFLKLTKAIEENVTLICDDDSRYIVWNSLLSFTFKHRQFNDAAWALPEEALGILEAITEKFAPSDRMKRAVRLFRENQYDLYLNDDDLDTATNKLNQLQIDEIEWCFKHSGLPGIKDFAVHVDRPEIVGYCLASIQEADELSQEICDQIVSENQKLCKLAEGYIPQRFARSGYQWIGEMIDDSWVAEKKASVLALLSLEKEVWIRAEKALGKDIGLFWARTTVWRIRVKEIDDIEYAVQKLSQFGRALEAVDVILNAIRDKTPVSVTVVIRTLNCVLEQPSEKITQHSAYTLSKTIQWLQDNSEDINALLQIEFQYLDILKQGTKPITIYKKLSSDPQFFCEFLNRAFNGEKGISQKLWGLLFFNWKRTPGLRDDGTLDVDVFNSWVENVKTKSNEINRYNQAMAFLGHALYHTPQDPDGCFIHKAAAKILQDDSDGHIREGYKTEAINSRGVHWVDNSGQAEFELEKSFSEKAKQADEMGYFRFAMTLRDIATSYHLEGVNNNEEE